MGSSSTSGDLGEQTRDLVQQAQCGDADAREKLARRFLGPLKRWARGRFPRSARRHLDTDDLVQNAMLNSFRNLDGFSPERSGAFLAYLRRALLNQIRDELRRHKARPALEGLPETLAVEEPSPLERAVGAETVERYEAALMKLSEEDREAVIMRIELDFTYPEIAEALGSPSANAVRMRIVRALLRLAESIHD